MGCTTSKRPDARVEKTLARLSEKEKKLDILIQQHQELIQKLETNSLQATQKIPNGSTNEIKVQNGKNEQNILPQNILEKEENEQISSKKSLQASNMNNEQKFDKLEKTVDRINQDNYRQQNHTQKLNDLNIPSNKEQSSSQNGYNPNNQNNNQNMIINTEDNHPPIKQATHKNESPSQNKIPSNIIQQQQNQQLQQPIHVIQNDQIYNSNNIIRITEDNEEFTMQTDQRGGQTQKYPHSIMKTLPTQRLSRGDDGDRKHTEDEVQQWTNLIQAFDDVSIRPIDNFQDKEQALSTDQIELDLGSIQKTSKSNGQQYPFPQQIPHQYQLSQQPYKTLPVGNGQNKMIQVNGNNNTGELIRPKTMQPQFDHLIHHPDILKVYQRVANSILIKTDKS